MAKWGEIPTGLDREAIIKKLRDKIKEIRHHTLLHMNTEHPFNQGRISLAEDLLDFLDADVQKDTTQ